MRLGALVYCVAYRNPGLHAKSLTTIDHLSGGRVDCGFGAGWHGVEARAFGYEFPRIGVREDMLEEYAQIMRLLLDRESPRANFQGRHFRLENAPNNPKPLQPRVPLWIGGRGEKRTLRAAARYADGWNAPYIGPAEWIAKGKVLDQWCETVNLGFYLGADARGAARGEAIFRQHWGAEGEQRSGWLRGTAKEVREMIAAFRDAACARVNIAFRDGPYDWDALHAFAEEVVAKA